MIKSKKVVIGVVAVAVLASLATTTRVGVFSIAYIEQAITGLEIPSDSSAAPVRLDGTLVITSELPMYQKIEQASGLFMSDSEVYVSTDQTEVFSLGTDLRNKNFKQFMIGGPLIAKQGGVEAVALNDRDEIVSVGESGSLMKLSRSGEKLGSVPFQGELATKEFSGLTFANGNYYGVTSKELDVYIVNHEGSLVQTISPDFTDRVKNNRSADELIWSGVSYANGKLYAVSLSYNIMAVISPENGVVEEVYGLEGDYIVPSGIAVIGQDAFIASDHAYFAQQPPVAKVTLP